MKDNLPYPFSKAFERGDSIDYIAKDGADYRYVERLGYNDTKMMPDCTPITKGIHGLTLSSYGDWGTLHTSSAEDNAKEVFLGMFDKSVIRLWRITAYMKNEDGTLFRYYYEIGKGWKTYDGEKWIACEDPYKGRNKHDGNRQD